MMENRIAEQIRFYRKQKGLTQEQLAEAMGVSVAAVSKWEQGQSLPEIPTGSLIYVYLLEKSGFQPTGICRCADVLT